MDPLFVKEYKIMLAAEFASRLMSGHGYGRLKHDKVLLVEEAFEYVNIFCEAVERVWGNKEED